MPSDLASIVKGLADSTCGRVALVLEGGYNLEALTESVFEIVKAFDEEMDVPISDEGEGEVSVAVKERVDEVMAVQETWWDF